MWGSVVGPEQKSWYAGFVQSRFLYQYFLGLCINYFSYLYKILDKGSLLKGGLIWAHHLRVSWRGMCGDKSVMLLVTLHPASGSREMKKANALLAFSTLFHFRTPAHEMVPPTVRVDIPTSVNPV